MKVIQRGTIPTPWWVGQRFTCDHCETVIELEAPDDPLAIPKANYSSHFTMPPQVRCPECDQSIVIMHDRAQKAA